MLIIDMPMPENCIECYFSGLCSYCEGYNDDCGLNKNGEPLIGFDKDGKEYPYWYFAGGISPKEKPSWCPLRELPEEHGDLIDRDKLKRAFCNHCDGRDTMNGEPNCTEPCFDIGLMDCMPVIIAAERKDDGNI